MADPEENLSLDEMRAIAGAAFKPALDEWVASQRPAEAAIMIEGFIAMAASKLRELYALCPASRPVPTLN